MEKVEATGCFRSLSEAVDTNTQVGEMTMQIIAALGEFERCTIADTPEASVCCDRTRHRLAGRHELMANERAEIRADAASPKENGS